MMNSFGQLVIGSGGNLRPQLLLRRLWLQRMSIAHDGSTRIRDIVALYTVYATHTQWPTIDTIFKNEHWKTWKVEKNLDQINMFVLQEFIMMLVILLMFQTALPVHPQIQAQSQPAWQQSSGWSQMSYTVRGQRGPPWRWLWSRCPGHCLWS